MIRIVVGQPGSGKTYYAVHYLAKFCEHDKLYNQYILRSDTLLVTNIEDIKVQHMHVDTFFREKMFHVEHIKKYMDSRGYKRVIIIIDECQKYLSKEALKEYGDEVNDIYFFFEYHRHIGCDIFLITQSVSSLPKRIVNLSEYIISARPRSVILPKVFLYDCLDTITGDRLFVVKIPKSDTVFKLYKSFEFQEVEKPKNFLIRKWGVGIVLFVIPLLIASFFVASGKIFGVAKNKTQQNHQVVYSSQNPFPNTMQTSSNTSTQTETSSNTLTQTETSSNTSTDVCIFASCEYPRLRRQYKRQQNEVISGKICYANECYYYVEQQPQEQQTQEQQPQEQRTQEQQKYKKEVKYKTPFSHWI